MYIVTLLLRDGPFNFQGGGGGYGFFLKNILIPNVAEKNILILVEEKNNNRSYNTNMYILEKIS